MLMVVTTVLVAVSTTNQLRTVEIVNEQLEPDDADHVSGLLKEVWT